jgi:hypothetical protein
MFTITRLRNVNITYYIMCAQLRYVQTKVPGIYVPL